MHYEGGFMRADQAVESLYLLYTLDFNCFMELVNFCLVCQ